MENVEWLKSHCDPWDEVISKWKATSVWRVESIKKDSESSLAFILDAWPGFKDPRGFDLVDIDFETMFPQVEESPSEKFAQLKKKLIPLFGMEIKDKYSKGLLKKLGDSSTNEDSQGCITSLLINALILPDRECGNKKPTIADAQRQMGFRVNSRKELEELISQQNNDLKIIAVGQDLTAITEVYVNCGPIFYKMSSYSRAMELLIKLSLLLHIDYPRKCRYAWKVLEGFCFSHATERVYDPKVQNLLNKLS
ncbi:uncharacterized protein LOC129806477 [Phlebotomus papatasi]|uniref:uncharacterized protein LOC129806477 n=1 Tax=Phlebotomus papatasi TaxID=29031 RepID=UPI0024845655|nr:uncharacterized protein LOC129806477 [Phlebotomus papatasi]